VLTKTKTPELHRSWTTRDRAANVRLYRLEAEVLAAVEASVFFPRATGTARCGTGAGHGNRALADLAVGPLRGYVGNAVGLATV
jgi:hypothetical protein